MLQSCSVHSACDRCPTSVLEEEVSDLEPSLTTPWRSHTPPPITPGGGGGRSKRGDETVTAELLLSDIGKNEWQIVFTRHIQTWQNNT